MNARRVQVCQLIATGRTNVQIAAELYHSEAWVKKEIAAAMREYGVDSRGALVACYLRDEMARKRSRRRERQAETLGLA